MNNLISSSDVINSYSSYSSPQTNNTNHRLNNHQNKSYFLPSSKLNNQSNENFYDKNDLDNIKTNLFGDSPNSVRSTPYLVSFPPSNNNNDDNNSSPTKFYRDSIDDLFHKNNGGNNHN